MLVGVVEKMQCGEEVVSRVGSVVRLRRLDQCPGRAVDSESGKGASVLRRSFLDLGDEIIPITVDRELRSQGLWLTRRADREPTGGDTRTRQRSNPT